MGTEIAQLYASITADTSQFQKSLAGVKSLLGDMAGLISGISFAGIMTSAVKSFSESEEVAAQLNATLKSTRWASGMTADAAQKLASTLQAQTRYSDEQVLSAENLLLTFTKVGKDVFPDATEAVLNMSTALGQDTKSSAIQLGKALQDPIKGVTALRRVGVMLSKDQEAQIKRFMQTNQLAKAQKIILQELSTEFGGSARAAGETLAGTMDRLRNAFDDVMETVGGALAPTIKTFANALVDLVHNAAPVLPIFVGIVAALVGIPALLGVIGAALGLIFSPIGLLVGAILGIKVAWDRDFGGIRTTVMGFIDFIKPELTQLRGWVEMFWETLNNPAAGQNLSKMDEFINKRFGGDNIAPSDFGTRFRAAIDTAWPGIKEALDKLGEKIKGYIKGEAGGWLGDILVRMTPLALLSDEDKTKFRNSLKDQVAAGGSIDVGKVVADMGIQAHISTTLQDLQNQIATWLNTAAGGIGTNVGNIGSPLNVRAGLVFPEDPLTTVQKALQPAIDWLGKEFKEAWDGVWGALTKAASGILAGIGGAIKGAALKALNDLADLLIGMAGLPVIGGNFEALGKALKEAKIGDSMVGSAGQGRAIGGPVLGFAATGSPAMGMYRVNELGQEFFRPAGSGMVTPIGPGGSGDINIQTVIVNGVQNPQAFYDAIRREAQRRNKSLAGSM